MYITGIDARQPMTSGYPRKDDQRRGGPKKKDPTPEQGDRVEISAAALDLAEGTERDLGAPDSP